MNSPLTTNRIDLVDALRGFALLAIILLHNLEHYNLYFNPEGFPEWLNVLDKGLWDSTWFMMAGKAFSTFSLLFGFSFFVQLDSQIKKGKPFRWRFAWRMVVLLAISQFHALFYNGDILLMYALMGLVLIPFSYLSNRWLAVTAIIMLLQPMEWWHIVGVSLDPSYTAPSIDWMHYAIPAKEAMENGNFAEIVASNITDGQLYSNLWQVSAGRLFQIPALFLFGMLLGRLGMFIKSERSVRFWIVVTTTAVLLLLFPLNILKNYVPELIENEKILTPYNTIFGSLWNFCFMVALVGCFALLWFHKDNRGYKVQRFIIPFGRMSLTNYIVQSIIGCGIYLGWGFGLYKYTGATFSLLIGVGIFILQLYFSRWWLTTHRQGPFEWLWKKLTWMDAKR